VQESITGSTFTGWIDVVDGEIIPNISGTAFLCGKSTLIFSEQDPFRWGIV
jgi:4-hydroxyproline epimerase